MANYNDKISYSKHPKTERSDFGAPKLGQKRVLISDCPKAV